MPQFDKISFFNQVFWLFCLFFGFYFIFLKLFLPKISFILKARFKKLQKGSSNLALTSKEQDLTNNLIEDTFEKSSLMIKNVIFNHRNRLYFKILSSQSIVIKTQLNFNIIFSGLVLESLITLFCINTSESNEENN